MFWNTILNGLLSSYISKEGKRYHDNIGDDAYKSLVNDITNSILGQGHPTNDDQDILKVEGLSEIDSLMALRSAFILGHERDCDRYIDNNCKDKLRPIVINMIENMEIETIVKKNRYIKKASNLTKALYLAKARESNLLNPEDVKDRINKHIESWITSQSDHNGNCSGPSLHSDVPNVERAG